MSGGPASPNLKRIRAIISFIGLLISLGGLYWIADSSRSYFWTKVKPEIDVLDTSTGKVYEHSLYRLGREVSVGSARMIVRYDFDGKRYSSQPFVIRTNMGRGRDIENLYVNPKNPNEFALGRGPTWKSLILLSLGLVISFAPLTWRRKGRK